MEEIRKVLTEILERVFSVSDVTPEVAVAPNDTGADFASNIAMQLASRLRRAPREIATEIVDEVAKLSAADFPFSATIAGAGFINFISSDEYFEQKLSAILASTGKDDLKFNSSHDIFSGKTVICEFSDPNPFKVLHVGHLYTSIVGDSIARLVESAGGRVIRANFGGDVGLHVAKTLYALRADRNRCFQRQCRRPAGRSPLGTRERSEDVAPAAHGDGPAGRVSRKQDSNLSAELLGQCYVEGTRAYEENETARQEIIALNKEIYRISRDDIHDGEFAELYWAGREASYRYFEEFYARVGVKFDKYYPESTVAGRGLSEVLAHVGPVYEKSGDAVIFPGEKYGLHTRVFVNAEGLPTYEAKDVGLLFTKWDDYHFDESIVITGNDIIDYMKVVLKSVSLYAPESVERTRHLTHGNVRLPGNEKMSSRKGNFIKAVDVLDEVSSMVSDPKIALGAIKYAFLKYRIGGNIEFNAKESVSTTGNSGVYLLYSAVRAKKIISKAQRNHQIREPDGARQRESECRPPVATTQANERTRSSLLVPSRAVASLKKTGRPDTCHESDGSVAPEERDSLRERVPQKQGSGSPERSLLRVIVRYEEVLSEAVRDLAPHKIAAYLYEVSQEFSRFYEKVKVVGSDAEAERTHIVEAYYKIMEHGLGLLGIEIPEEM